MKNKICEILKLLGIDSVLKDETESPQLRTFYYDLNDSRQIVKLNSKAIEIISDYLKEPVEIVKGGAHSFSVCIPKHVPDTVDLTKIKQYKNRANNIRLTVGLDVNNDPVRIDFNKVNHMLVAGATGSGKSVFINSLLCALISSTPLDSYDLKLIDPKRVSFNAFKPMPNVELITEVMDASKLLDSMIDLMEERYQYMEGNRKTDKNIFKPIFIIVDELAELMLVDRGGCEEKLIRLLQKARQANIHIILATQRPTTDVISGLIKAQCDTRVCLKMASLKDSVTVIDKGIGKKLLGRGDAYIKFPYEVQEHRFQTAFIPEKEIRHLVNERCRDAAATAATKAITAKEKTVMHAARTVVSLGSGHTVATASPLDGIEIIENERVRNLARKCVENVISWGYSLPRHIEWGEDDSDNWLALTRFKVPSIILNRRLHKQGDIMIQITVYHELAHLIAGPEANHAGAWRKVVDDFHDKTGFIFGKYAPVTII